MKGLLRHLGMAAAITGLVLAAASAQVKKKTGKKGPGILQAEWGKVEKGTYAAPMGKLGSTPEAVWTATTMGAAIDGKPNPAKITTVVGEILDFSCYLQIGKHGEKHRSCAQKCFNAGQPIGLLAEDGTMYLLMEEEHDPRRDGLTDFRKAAIEHAAHIMEVTGTLSEHGGYKALYVHGYLKK
ncbi:MAG: hypothetical protein NZV14_12895 [Bryobacteraceae bacterium]|nr:hypothetical protein [Bryobacteraceae bacterium]MDW8379053.1 hypothetical protein [Bryobacterales bacterium]